MTRLPIAQQFMLSQMFILAREAYPSFKLVRAAWPATKL